MEDPCVSRIDVFVAATSHDVKADGIAAAVAARGDMTLAAEGVLKVQEVEAVVQAFPPSSACALIIVGPHADTEDLAARWLIQHRNLVVLRVDVVTDLLHLMVRNTGLERLLSALRVLIDMPYGTATSVTPMLLATLACLQ